MGRDHGRIFTSIWRDDDWTDLSKDAQRLYMLLVTQPDLTFVGTLPYRPGLWAQWSSDDDPSSCALALKELCETSFVLVDEDTMECLIRTFVKHDPGVLNSPNMVKAARKDWQALYSDRLKAHVAFQVREVMAGRSDDKHQMVAAEFPEPWSDGWLDGTPSGRGSTDLETDPPEGASGGDSVEGASSLGATEQSQSQSQSQSQGTRTRGSDDTNGSPRWDTDWARVRRVLKRYGSNRPMPDDIPDRARAAVRHLGGMRVLGSMDEKSAKFEFRDAWREVG